MFIVFIFYIATISGVLGGVNDLFLHGIDSIFDTRQLFTGLAYRLEHENNADLVLAWIENEGKFKFSQQDDGENKSTFFLVHSGSGNFRLRNSVINDTDIVVQCEEVTKDGTDHKICYLTDGKLTPARPYPNVFPLISAYLPRQGSTANVYVMDNIVNPPVSYSYDSEISSNLVFRFVPLVDLESEIIAINTTTPPMETLSEFLPQSEKVWVETVLNPTPVSRQKVLKEVMVFTERKTITTDNNVHEYFDSELTWSFQSSIKDPITGNDAITILSNHSTVRSVEIMETITIPEFTCVEIHLISETARTKQQNISAQMRIAGKTTRLSTTNGITRERLFVPGLVIEQVMNEKNFVGKYVETRNNDAIYEVSGKVETNKGIHTSLIVHNIECPGNRPRN